MITLSHDTLQLEVDPQHGGTWRNLRWRHPDGAWRDLLVPLQGDGFGGGNFIMAPFCNRICDGAFTVDGRRYQLPINQVDEGMAIHGHVREKAWQVVDQDARSVRMELRVADDIWTYAIEQHIRIDTDQITAGLTLTNLGEKAMPFGIGFHPWFPRQARTQISFPNTGAYRKDARALPLPERDMIAGLDPNDPQPLDDIQPLDHCFSGWIPQEAQLAWPEQRYQMRMTASNAFSHLQLYSPQGRAFCCLEPVSHLPDAINRPALGASGQMEMLPPQAQMHGEMSLLLSQL